MKTRHIGDIANLIVAVGVNDQGRREVLGMAIGASEAETFWIEFLRGDPRGAAVGISTSQWIGLAMAAGGILWLWLGYRRSPEGRLPEVKPA